MALPIGCTLSQSTVPGLADADLPGLFRAADRAAILGQRRHVRVTVIQLAMLILAVLSGVTTQVTSLSYLGFVGVAAYIVLVTARVYGRISHQEALWYENRLLAESIRSLAWRFSIGGAPFSRDDDASAPDDYASRISDILADMKHAPVPDVESGIALITDPMKRLRSRPLEERRGAYAEHRVMGQLHWYAARSKKDATRSAYLDAWFLVASAAAVFFGLLQAFGVTGVNLLGLFGVLAASIYTWQSQRRYSKQATSYAAAANHLTLVHTRIGKPGTDAEWAQFVDDAEDGIGREHTSWRVSRSQR